ncbi:ABC transporter permease [Anaerolineales bacterium]
MTESSQGRAAGFHLPFVTRLLASIRHFLREMSKNKIAFIAFWIVIFYILLAMIGPMIAPYGYRESHRSTTDCTTTASGREICSKIENSPPTLEHPLGTDRNGRDVLSRILWGARETMGLPLVSAIFAVLVGSMIGLLAGYRGGWVDEAISRTADILLAIPALVLALVMMTGFVPIFNATEIGFLQQLDATSVAIVLVVIFLYTPIVTRVIRSATVSLRSAGFIEAARLRGESTYYILFREILPGVLPALVVEASLRFSYAIFLVASLGFLGLGVQPPSPEWGRMVLDAYKANAISTAPWSLWAPAIAIASLIISINLMADGLRRILRYERDR